MSDHISDNGLTGRLAKVIESAFSQLSRLDQMQKGRTGARVTLKELATIDLQKNKALEKESESKFQKGWDHA